MKKKIEIVYIFLCHWNAEEQFTFCRFVKNGDDVSNSDLLKTLIVMFNHFSFKIVIIVQEIICRTCIEINFTRIKRQNIKTGNVYNIRTMVQSIEFNSRSRNRTFTIPSRYFTTITYSFTIISEYLTTVTYSFTIPSQYLTTVTFSFTIKSQ